MTAPSRIVAAVDTGARATKFTCLAPGAHGELVIKRIPSLPAVVARDDGSDGLVRRGDVAMIRIGDTVFAVGPDAARNVGASVQTTRDRGYAGTDGYLALTIGALHYGGYETIDRLVVGLPLHTYKTMRAVVAERLVGTHAVGLDTAAGTPARTITIRAVDVVPQAFGAAVHHDAINPRRHLLDDPLLVLDLGEHTLIHLVMDDGGVNPERSDAIEGGTAMALEAVDAAISRMYSAQHKTFSLRHKLWRYSEALMRPEPVLATPFGKVPLEPYYPVLVQEVRRQLGKAMVSVGDISDIGNVVLTGGGLMWLRMVLADYPGMPGEDNLIFSHQGSDEDNVRGYHVFGRDEEERVSGGSLEAA